MGAEVKDASVNDWRQVEGVALTPLLAAALDAFYEGGFHGSTVRDIASRVGVTVPTIYYHYGNKEGLLFALLQTSIDRVTEVCAAALAEAADDAGVSFAYLIEALVLYMTNSTKLAALDPEIRSLTAQHRSIYAAKRRDIQVTLSRAIEHGCEDGIFHVTSASNTARALLGMIQAVATWFRPDGSLTAVEVARSYVDISAHAVGASPAVVQRLVPPWPEPRDG
jgi:AcrR family transcriptional regulator